MTRRVHTFSVSWATRREGNQGYVLETHSGRHKPIEFGPMPAHTVPAFVAARRRIIATIAGNSGYDHKRTQTNH